MAQGSLYDSERLAAAYAGSRPPVHPRIMAAARTRLAALGVPRVRRALDIGCGAGLSTAALQPLALAHVGIEPVLTMLRHHGQVAPGALFVAGRAERLPFASRAFDLVAAAGALNYADRSLALPEIARVLSSRGVLLIYDFSGGRRTAGDGRLDEWFASFERRYPYPPGYPMEVRRIDFASAGLHLEAYEELEIEIPMSSDAFLAYVMSETNVEQALREGASETEIRTWCAEGMGGIFGDGARGVLFDAYVAYVRHQPL